MCKIFALIAPFLFASVASCSSLECDYFVDVVNDPGLANQIETWADDSIFNRTFSSDDFSAGGNIFGPGEVNFSLSSRVAPPEFVPGPTNAINKIRPLGPEREVPVAVFFGERSFAGIVVFKNSIEEDVLKIGMRPEAFDATNGRVAAICRDER